LEVNMEKIKEFYLKEGKLHERHYTIYYEELEKAKQTAAPVIVRVRQIHYDQPVEKFPEIGPR
jgi:hypothetical protein